MSEALFLINPGKRRKKSRKGKMPAGLRRYWAAKRAGKVTRKRVKRRRVSKTRRRLLSRSIASYKKAGLVHPRAQRKTMRNPHRRKHYAVSRRRHRRMRNPFSIRGITHVVMPAAIGAGGAIALDVVMAYAAPYLPASMQTGIFPGLVKLAGAIGLGFGARKVLGREKGNAITLGALTVTGYGLIKPIIASFAPSIKGLAGFGYIDDSGGYAPSQGIGFYSPASVITPAEGVGMSGMGAYLNRGMNGLGRMGAYVQPGMNGLGEGSYSSYQPDWSNDKM